MFFVMCDDRKTSNKMCMYDVRRVCVIFTPKNDNNSCDAQESFVFALNFPWKIKIHVCVVVYSSCRLLIVKQCLILFASFEHIPIAYDRLCGNGGLYCLAVFNVLRTYAYI